MKLIILCGILSVLLAVSLASPVKLKGHDTFDSSDSSESSESRNVEKNTSSSEEEIKQVKNVNFNVMDNNEEENSADTSEEQFDSKNVVKDEFTVDHSVEGTETERKKRAVDFVSHPINQLLTKDEDSFKYHKHLKLKDLKVALESDETPGSLYISPRFVRSADTSEESSSEENNKEGKKHGAHKHSESPVEKSSDNTAGDNIVTETVDGANSLNHRRKRNPSYSSEEDLSTEEISKNEVFIFSNEKQDSAENLQNFHLKNIEDFVLNENVFKKLEKSQKSKNSEEDYAQGCGGNGNQDDDSNESTDENNEATFDKL